MISRITSCAIRVHKQLLSTPGAIHGRIPSNKIPAHRAGLQAGPDSRGCALEDFAGGAVGA